ncbi:unnamed protein product [Cladocopium goreaui]|uniref:Uncharacterized protein n=1 Tax=Cladocopium goreaui TaxID=2562237 RepID=A0A9P1BYR0_9DINO|nr:unnamed protein product [Cladocopium goreaui]
MSQWTSLQVGEGVLVNAWQQHHGRIGMSNGVRTVLEHFARRVVMSAPAVLNHLLSEVQMRRAAQASLQTPRKKQKRRASSEDGRMSSRSPAACDEEETFRRIADCMVEDKPSPQHECDSPRTVRFKGWHWRLRQRPQASVDVEATCAEERVTYTDGAGPRRPVSRAARRNNLRVAE